MLWLCICGSADTSLTVTETLVPLQEGEGGKMRSIAAVLLIPALLGLASARPPQVAKGPGVQYHHGQPMQPEATEEEDWGLGVEYNK